MLRAGALGNLGQLRMGRLELDEAEQLLGRAVEVGRASLSLAPRNVDPLRKVAVFGSNLARLRLFRGDRAGAAEAARAAGDLPRASGERPESLVDAASLLARCAPAVGDSERQRVYEDRAAALLQMAVAKGFRDVARLARDSDLFGLMGRPDTQLLMMDLVFPAEPFAATR